MSSAVIVIRTADRQIEAPDGQPYTDGTGKPEVWYYRDSLKAWTTRLEYATRYSDEPFAAAALRMMAPHHPDSKLTVATVADSKESA